MSKQGRTNGADWVSPRGGEYPEAWNYHDEGTIVNGAAVQFTQDVSSFIPWKKLRFQETGTQDVTWTVQMRPGSKPILQIAGAAGATLSVNGVFDDDSVSASTIQVQLNDGSIAPATSLVPGQYLIEV